MLQMHTYFNTAELERLRSEGELPVGLSIGTVQKHMSGGDAILLLFRDSATWETEAVLIDIPVEGYPGHRKIVAVYCRVAELPGTAFNEHLTRNNFTQLSIHIPSSTHITDNLPKWVVYRHVRQALGALNIMQILLPNMVDFAIDELKHKEAPNAWEVHVSREAITEFGQNLRRIIKLGFISRKFEYVIS